MGNPQCILLVEDFGALDWLGLGAELERHPFFPDRANIGFVRVVSHVRIEARFWERGAGYTLASGTGSCACAVAAHLAGKTKRRVLVALERGELEVNWRADEMVELTGPAEITVAGTFLG
jgi:diaminopimelate epimerase